MAIAPSLTDTLVAVADILAATRDPWWIIGSAAVALHGGVVTVADVDVLMAPADARTVIATLGLVDAGGAGTDRFRSAVFARWIAPPLTVEIMADFSVFTRESWTPVRPATRTAIGCGGATLFVPEREELRALLRAFGREKDRARAAAL